MIGLQVVLLVSLLAAGCTSFNLTYNLPKDDYWLVPNHKNDTFNLIARALVTAELGAMTNIPDLVTYYLYTQDNRKGHLLTKDNANSLKQSTYDPKQVTRIVIHGFQSSGDERVCTLLQNAYLNKYPINVICVDWAPIASKSYPTARFVAPSVGRDVAEFIQFLTRDGQMKIKDLLVIGHSLGAHIAGTAGKMLKKNNMNIPVIVGCDPAQPLYSYSDCSSRLCKTDANFVETIQTDGGKFGFLKPIGSGTYYPNGGKNQPGCGVELVGVCSHSRSYEYIAEAIERDDFATIKCQNYRDALRNRCGKTISPVTMGSHKDLGVDGIFYVPVNGKYPYGKKK